MHLGFHCNSQPVGGTPVSTEEVVPVLKTEMMAHSLIGLGEEILVK